MKKNILWNTSGSVFYYFCQWLFTIITARAASFEAAGCLSLAMTYSSSFSAISLFSMRNFQASDARQEYRAGIYVGSRILTGMAALACCAAAAFWGSTRYQAACIILFMLIRSAEAAVDVLHGIDQKHGRYDIIGKSYFLRGTASLLSFGAGMVFAESLFLSLCMAAACSIGAAFWYDFRKTDSLEKIVPEVRSPEVWKLLKTCVPLVMLSFLLSLVSLIPKTVLQREYGEEALGIYSSMASVTLVVQLSASVVFNPFLPKLSQWYADGRIKEFGRLMHKLYVISALMGAAVTAGALAFGKIGLKMLLGSQILEYWELFLPIVWCTCLTGITWILSAVLTGMRKIRLAAAGMAADFLLCLALARPLVLRYGKNGVSFVQIAVLSVYIVFMILVCEWDIWKRKSS